MRRSSVHQFDIESFDILRLSKKRPMAVSLNHTIVPATDKRASADFLSRILGLLEPTPWGPFLVVPIPNEITQPYGATPEG
jgi:hypothetical protein